MRIRQFFLVCLLAIGSPSCFSQSSGGCSITADGNLTCPGTVTAGATINGVVHAENWPTGGDACAKIDNAIQYAAANGQPLVDASGFSGTQICTSGVNFLGHLVTGMTLRLGVTHFQTAVPLQIVNNGVAIVGAGSDQTIIEYTGTTVASAVLTLATASPSTSSRVQHANLHGFALIGGNANATDGLLLWHADYGQYRDIGCWGIIESCIHTRDAIVSSFTDIITTYGWASHLGFYTSSHTTPAHQFYLDADSGWGTNATVVIDARAEGLLDTAWWMQNASSATFIGGTAEGNNCTPATLWAQPCTAQIPTDPGNVYISSTSSNVNLTGTWSEGSGNYDIYDDGDNDGGIGIVASTSSSGSSIQIGPGATFAHWPASNQVWNGYNLPYQSWSYQMMASNAAGSDSWIKLGTWISLKSGDSIRLSAVNGPGYGSSGAQDQGITEVIARMGNGTAAPNLSTISAWTFGNNGILGVKFAATNGSIDPATKSWDVYLHVAAYSPGFYTVSMSRLDRWLHSDTAASDPGISSSTVAVGNLTTIQDGTGVAPEVTLKGYTFASLPVGSNGQMVYCNDCKNVYNNSAAVDSIAISGGAGAFVFFQNGAWHVK